MSQLQRLYSSAARLYEFLGTLEGILVEIQRQGLVGKVHLGVLVVADDGTETVMATKPMGDLIPDIKVVLDTVR